MANEVPRCFIGREHEWSLYEPLVGETMLELGDKWNPEQGHVTYKSCFEELGYRHVSVDLNGRNGALPLDLTKPLNLGTFDMVTNIGTTEHVDKQEPVWRNVCEAMHVGSVLISTTPKPHGPWPHGIWLPTEEFFEELAALNGMTVQRLYIDGKDHRIMVMARLVRMAEHKFVMPNQKLIVRR